MKSYWFLLSFLMISPLMLFAQNSRNAADILEKSAALFEKSNGVEARFSLKESDPTTGGGTTVEGTLYNKGKKFFIETPDTETWFDGTTQWSYLKNNAEVNVTTPSKEEASSLNPVSLLRLYKRGFKTAFIGTKTLGNYKVDEIELIPEKKEFPWKKITFFINNQNHQPVSVRIWDKKGDLIEIKFLSFNMQANLKDADFVFNKNKYPDAEIIDLR